MRLMAWLARFLLVLVAVISTQSAYALTIEGLQTFEPLLLHNVNASATNGKLEIRYPQGYLSIQPWPDFLPREMTNQVVQAERQIWPAGPSDLVTFTRINEQAPWLIVGNHSRSATHLVGNWSLQLVDGDWYVADETQKRRLETTGAQSGMVCIFAESAYWHVYSLGDATEKSSQAGSVEYEPRISWIAVRRDSRDKH